MSEQEIDKGVEASLKSLDTEEFIDIHFYRPIGYRWALFFQKLGVSPNAITFAGIFLGIAAGIMFYFPDLKLNIIGMLLLVWANSYDSADGQLARLTGQKTELGRMLDGLSGDAWFISIYVCLCMRLTPDFSYGIWIFAAITGYFHSKQAAMADYYRNIHLYFLKGKSGSEFDNSAQQYEQFRALFWKGNFWRKFSLYFYGAYTASQEKYTPKFQRFFAAVKEQYGDNIPQSLRDSFRTMSKPLMKYTNILSFNTRVIALFVSLLVNLPWLYFVFEITVLNGLLVYMVLRHESLSSVLYNHIKSDDKI